ncbi:hypothetical protein AB0F42_14255 [Streptomyces buecherae]|uniref:hypothetical protein n=1 Tax=Streptomyces buecherae TaxID=2763006 RepID=UPI0033E0E8A0
MPGGGYVVPDGVLQLRGQPVPRTRESALQDTATAHRLWARSEQLTGVRYPWPTEPPRAG